MQQDRLETGLEEAVRQEQASAPTGMYEQAEAQDLSL